MSNNSEWIGIIVELFLFVWGPIATLLWLIERRHRQLIETRAERQYLQIQALTQPKPSE